MNLLHLKSTSKKYISINLGLVILFAFLYYLSNFIDKSNGIKNLHGSENNSMSFMDALGYSLITQTTVGYTVFIPMTQYTKNINLLQLISIIIVVGLFI